MTSTMRRRRWIHITINMPTLLKIGLDYYAVKNPKDAAACINALVGAVKLRRDYSAKDDAFYPDEHQDEIGMITVRVDQLRAAKFDDSEMDTNPKQLPVLAKRKSQPSA